MCRINLHINPSPLQSSGKCSFFRLFGTTTVFFVKWKWQKMDDGRCPTGGAVYPMLEPPVTVTDMQAVTGRNSCHSWWKTSDLLSFCGSAMQLFENSSNLITHTEWQQCLVWIRWVKFQNKLSSFYPPSGSIWIFFFLFCGSLNFNNLSQRRTIQTFPQRFSIFEYSAFLKKILVL